MNVPSLGVYTIIQVSFVSATTVIPVTRIVSDGLIMHLMYLLVLTQLYKYSKTGKCIKCQVFFEWSMNKAASRPILKSVVFVVRFHPGQKNWNRVPGPAWGTLNRSGTGYPASPVTRGPGLPGLHLFGLVRSA